MNKNELVDRVQQGLGEDCSKAHAERAVNTVLASITEGLQSDRAVQLIGFGTFQVKQRAARTGRNPRTGEAMEIGASQTVGFKPGQALKSSL